MGELPRWVHLGESPGAVRRPSRGEDDWCVSRDGLLAGLLGCWDYHDYDYYGSRSDTLIMTMITMAIMVTI